MEFLYYVALASKVLAVAVKREVGWCAYCDTVDGENHQREYQAVMYDGDKLPEDIARAIFPQYKDMVYEH